MNATVLAPIGHLQDYRPVAHPNLRAFRASVRRVIDALDALSELEPPTRSWTVDMTEVEARETWRVALRHMRAAQLELESGLATQRLLRDARKLARNLASEFEAARRKAVVALKEDRAFAAVMADENDDVELGIAVVPSPVEPPPRCPSRAFQW